MELALSILGGLVVLTFGAELLVRGAVRLAEGFGVSPLLIGLTIVGFGTSTPELVTSVQGALAGSPGIAVGNIVGSNLFNILVILGIAAAISPMAVPKGAIGRDGVLVIATAAIFVAVGYVWTLDRLVGLAFLAMLAAYLTFAAMQERQAGTHTLAHDKGEALAAADPGLRPDHHAGGQWRAGLLVLAGLVLLVVGGRFFVTGSIELARLMGISEAVIGLTVVAAGTSMPELATSLVAAFRRQADVAIGNVLGSNIYNLLGIGGVTAVISPTDIPDQIVGFDNLAMLAASVVLLAMLWTGRRLSRAEGLMLLAGYGAYLWWIWPAPGAV
ncbi:MAG: calcium/sodium antiporter [Rhodobacteraceae bacterium]|jgi:cation:H+ antiporter|nr:calcium/sodium antiporter [Paracoccaceae bacterium]